MFLVPLNSLQIRRLLHSCGFGYLFICHAFRSFDFIAQRFLFVVLFVTPFARWFIMVPLDAFHSCFSVQCCCCCCCCKGLDNGIYRNNCRQSQQSSKHTTIESWKMNNPKQWQRHYKNAWFLFISKENTYDWIEHFRMDFNGCIEVRSNDQTPINTSNHEMNRRKISPKRRRENAVPNMVLYRHLIACVQLKCYLKLK